METLLELLPRIRALGSREAIRFSNGIRTWKWSYRDLDNGITRFAGYLDRQGFAPGDRLLLWSENRPEWIAVFWACLSRGVVVVPLDAHSTPHRVAGIRAEAGTRLLVRGSNRADFGPEHPVFRIEDLPELPLPANHGGLAADADGIVEILYTSGTTADPKGVVHRHRNICSNLTPIDREIDRYRHWARPFQPVRFLDMLPLSHMFGQSMGVFTPVLLGGAVVLTSDLHPASIRRTIRTERVSVLVTVPHVLETLGADIRKRHPETGIALPEGEGVLKRCWRYRKIHREFGWKFWSLVVGGAELNPSIEGFWSRIGMLVVQGYGLTETSPVVTLNHPFRARRGTVGKTIGDQEIRIAEDGEVWVRGPSVVEEYTEGRSGVRPATDAEGWFHTGDIGELDSEGNLVYRGRKKDIIVTADGINVYPGDIEQVLNEAEDIRDSVVIPVRGAHGELPHAVLILEGNAEGPEALIAARNRLLEPGQRIRSWSIWTGEDFPRTASTHKIQRRLVAESVSTRTPDTPEDDDKGPSGFLNTLTRLSGPRGRDLAPDTRLTEELGLSSLERIDLLAGLESRYGIELEEADFSEATTVAELDAQVGAARKRLPSVGRAEGVQIGNRLSPPRWSRYLPVRAARSVLQTVLIYPLLRCFVRLSVEGVENLASLPGPVLFASNHASHFDTPIIVTSLPRRWRPRIAPAVRLEYFQDERHPFVRGLEYFLVSLAFNTYPLPQQLGRVRESLRYTGDLVSSGYCPLVFPEGKRTEDGALGTLQSGVGFMAVRLQIPVVPLHLAGTFEALPPGAAWPHPGPVRLKIGPPVWPIEDESYTSFTGRLEATLRTMA